MYKVDINLDKTVATAAPTTPNAGNPKFPKINNELKTKVYYKESKDAKGYGYLKDFVK